MNDVNRQKALRVCHGQIQCGEDPTITSVRTVAALTLAEMYEAGLTDEQVMFDALGVTRKVTFTFIPNPFPSPWYYR
jgi:hypothetical protein